MKYIKARELINEMWFQHETYNMIIFKTLNSDGTPYLFYKQKKGVTGPIKMKYIDLT